MLLEALLGGVSHQFCLGLVILTVSSVLGVNILREINSFFLNLLFKFLCGQISMHYLFPWTTQIISIRWNKVYCWDRLELFSWCGLKTGPDLVRATVLRNPTHSQLPTQGWNILPRPLLWTFQIQLNLLKRRQKLKTRGLLHKTFTGENSRYFNRRFLPMVKVNGKFMLTWVFRLTSFFSGESFMQWAPGKVLSLFNGVPWRTS